MIEAVWLVVVFSLAIIVLIIAYYLFKEEKEEKIDFENSEIVVNSNFEKNVKEVEDILYKEFNELDIKIEDILKLKQEISKKIVGLDNLINGIIIGILANGHVLVEGVPGLAKTKTISLFSQLLGLDFKRLQFTPDMLPSDIIGTLIYNQKIGDFETKKGPIFTNILLADEINRTTPKVQSALLEAMQERKVNIGGVDYELPNPFFVLATQNPIEQEGTYPLPEAQVDRFLFKILVSYPTSEEEKFILDIIEKENNITLETVLTKDKLMQLQNLIQTVYVSSQIKDYIVKIVNILRKPDNRIQLGPSPRGSIGLLSASKVIAFLQGRDYVVKEDVLRTIFPILRHRLILSYDAKIEGINAEDLIKEKVLKINF